MEEKIPTSGGDGADGTRARVTLGRWRRRACRGDSFQGLTVYDPRGFVGGTFLIVALVVLFHLYLWVQTTRR